MINSIKVTNYLGESLTIEMRNPEKSGFFIKRIDGLGPSKSTLNMTDIMSIDGAFFNSARSEKRNIVLDIGFLWIPNMTIETLRQQTYRFFPNKRLLYLEIETDNRIGCAFGYVESNEPNVFDKQESTVVSIICPDAYFFERDEVNVPFNEILPLFSFPLLNPTDESTIQFGEVHIYTQRELYYVGDEDTGVIISISSIGTVSSNIVITNQITGEQLTITAAQVLALTGSYVKDGDLIVVSTLKGAKTMKLYRGNTVYNILNALGSNSTFLLLHRGENVFTYDAGAYTTKLMVEIDYNVLYGGI